MPILNDKAIYDLKWNYNLNLNRYKNGCEYLKEHKRQMKKWLPELLSVLENINLLLEEIMKYEQVTEFQILEGFDLDAN